MKKQQHLVAILLTNTTNCGNNIFCFRAVIPNAVVKTLPKQFTMGINMALYEAVMDDMSFKILILVY